MATIVVLEHAFQHRVKETYLLYDLVKRWRHWGHTVTRHCGLKNAPEADLAILNVDLTVRPEPYLELAARYPRTINGAVRDVSKRTFSQLLVDRDSDYTGPVIVKTNANARGVMDRFIARQEAKAKKKPVAATSLTLTDYRVFRSLQKVPAAVWEHSGLVVEKFLPERDEHGYYSRHWSFLGDQESSSRYRAAVPIIKSRDMLERVPIEVPEEIREWRRRLGFDFGKFDFVKHNGKYLLLDVNPTPTVPEHGSAASEAGRALMARGIDVFLKPEQRIVPPEAQSAG